MPAPPASNDSLAAKKNVPIRVIVIDDHEVVRRGVVAYLGACPDMTVVGEADGLDSALSLISRVPLDVVISDLSLPDSQPLEFIERLLKHKPGLKIVVFTMHSETVYMKSLLKLGVFAFIRKTFPLSELAQAVRLAKVDRKYINAAQSELLVEMLESKAGRYSETLSKREYQVFEALGSGKNTHQIADQLGLSVKTVCVYRARAIEKLGLKSSTELVCTAVKYCVESERDAGRRASALAGA